MGGQGGPNNLRSRLHSRASALPCERDGWCECPHLEPLPQLKELGEGSQAAAFHGIRLGMALAGGLAGCLAAWALVLGPAPGWAL